MSFSEGSQLYSLEVESNKKIAFLENNSFLAQKIFLKENNQFFYRLVSAKKDAIINIEKEIKENSEIRKIEINY